MLNPTSCVLEPRAPYWFVTGKQMNCYSYPLMEWSCNSCVASAMCMHIMCMACVTQQKRIHMFSPPPIPTKIIGISLTRGEITWNLDTEFLEEEFDSFLCMDSDGTILLANRRTLFVLSELQGSFRAKEYQLDGTTTGIVKGTHLVVKQTSNGYDKLTSYDIGYQYAHMKLFVPEEIIIDS